jgi:hypothetical protein
MEEPKVGAAKQGSQLRNAGGGGVLKEKVPLNLAFGRSYTHFLPCVHSLGLEKSASQVLYDSQRLGEP